MSARGNHEGTDPAVSATTPCSTAARTPATSAGAELCGRVLHELWMRRASSKRERNPRNPSIVKWAFAPAWASWPVRRRRRFAARSFIADREAGRRERFGAREVPTAATRVVAPVGARRLRTHVSAAVPGSRSHYKDDANPAAAEAGPDAPGGGMLHFTMRVRGFRSQLRDARLIQELLEDAPAQLGSGGTMPAFVRRTNNGVRAEDCGISAFVFLAGGHLRSIPFLSRDYFADLVAAGRLFRPRKSSRRSSMPSSRARHEACRPSTGRT